MKVKDLFDITDSHYFYNDMKSMITCLSDSKSIFDKILLEFDDKKVITRDSEKIIDNRYKKFTENQMSLILGDKVITYNYNIDILSSINIEDNKFHTRNELAMEIDITRKNSENYKIRFSLEIDSNSKYEDLIISLSFAHFDYVLSDNNFKSDFTMVVGKTGLLKSIILNDLFFNPEHSEKSLEFMIDKIKNRPAKYIGSLKNIKIIQSLSDQQLIFLLKTGGFSKETVDMISLTQDNFKIEDYERTSNDNFYNKFNNISKTFKKIKI